MQIDTSMTHQNASVRNGYWFYFKDGATRITVFVSAVSTKEVVYVDEDTVSTRHSFTLRSRHSFHHGDHDYQVEVRIKNFLTGEVECVLYRDGLEFERTSKAFFDKGTGGRRYLLSALIGGAVTGFVISLLAHYVWK